MRNPILRKKSKRLSKFLFVSVAFSLFSACVSEHAKLVEKADQEALKQKSQLAKYLYVQVVDGHKEKDDIRYRALKGLAEVSMAQLFDYQTAVKAMEKIFEEYDQVPAYQAEIKDMRLKASKIWRINLETPRRSLDVLSPYLAGRIKSLDAFEEIGHVFIALNQYDDAKAWFLKAWNLALTQESCSHLNDLQLNLVQTHSLKGECKEALQWANERLPATCTPARFSLELEKAHCFEMLGEVNKAMSIYEELIKSNPENTRAHFFLESLKQRQKDKASK